MTQLQKQDREADKAARAKLKEQRIRMPARSPVIQIEDRAPSYLVEAVTGQWPPRIRC